MVERTAGPRTDAHLRGGVEDGRQVCARCPDGREGLGGAAGVHLLGQLGCNCRGERAARAVRVGRGEPVVAELDEAVLAVGVDVDHAGAGR